MTLLNLLKSYCHEIEEARRLEDREVRGHKTDHIEYR
jgi:hypothetical protein